MTHHHVTFRASPVLMARIEELAEAHGSRSAAIKAAILEATLSEHATPVPDEHEVLCLLGQAARSGSVAAMRELLAYHRERRHPAADTDPLAAVDELTERRRPGRSA